MPFFRRSSKAALQKTIESLFRSDSGLVYVLIWSKSMIILNMNSMSLIVMHWSVWSLMNHSTEHPVVFNPQIWSERWSSSCWSLARNTLNEKHVIPAAALRFIFIVFHNLSNNPQQLFHRKPLKCASDSHWFGR